jgi:uncharacterized protein YndB with AHSA1/START domain
MSSPQSAATLQNSLVVSRTVQASRERVFSAWTEAAELARWFAPSADFTVVPTVDLRVGGDYRIEMQRNDGTSFTVFGTYREIVAPEKLTYTWQWEADPTASQTLVEIEFRSLGESTEVTLTHQFLPSEIERDKHSHGWDGCLNRLASLF